MKRVRYGLSFVGMLCVLLGQASCSPPPTRGRGGPCQSLTDCKPGLVCDDGKCTRDLDGLSGQTDAPPFTMFFDAGADDAGASVDAGPIRDAGPVRDAGPRDAGSANDGG